MLMFPAGGVCLLCRLYAALMTVRCLVVLDVVLVVFMAIVVVRGSECSSFCDFWQAQL